MARRSNSVLSSGSLKNDIKKPSKTKSLSKSPVTESNSATSITLNSDQSEQNEEPLHRKCSALAYAVLKEESCTELLTMKVDAMEKKLKEVFELNPEADVKDAALLDQYVGAAYWAKQQNFNEKQLSGFFAVIYKLIMEVKEEKTPFVEAVKKFTKMLVGIEAELENEDQSGGLEFLTLEQAKAVSQYIHTSFFQHYKLYELLFDEKQSETLLRLQLEVEVIPEVDAPFPPTLDEAMPEWIYEDYYKISPEQKQEMYLQEAEKSIAESHTEDEETEKTSLPPAAQDILEKLTAGDIKAIIEEVSSEVFKSLQSGVEAKLKSTENNVLGRIDKIHNILSDPDKGLDT